MRRLSANKGPADTTTATSTPPQSFRRAASGGGALNGPIATAAAPQLNQEELESVRKFSSELRGKSLDELKSSKIIDRYLFYLN